MNIAYMAGAAFRALTARKDGPSIYDVCDPILLNGHGGNAPARNLAEEWTSER